MKRNVIVNIVILILGFAQVLLPSLIPIGLFLPYVSVGLALLHFVLYDYSFLEQRGYRINRNFLIVFLLLVLVVNFYFAGNIIGSLLQENFELFLFYIILPSIAFVVIGYGLYRYVRKTISPTTDKLSLIMIIYTILVSLGVSFSWIIIELSQF